MQKIQREYSWYFNKLLYYISYLFCIMFIISWEYFEQSSGHTARERTRCARLVT